jgi:hypothetical protein
MNGALEYTVAYFVNSDYLAIAVLTLNCDGSSHARSNCGLRLGATLGAGAGFIVIP